MLCPKCGTEVPNGSFFCAECGADIIPDTGGDAAGQGTGQPRPGPDETTPVAEEVASPAGAVLVDAGAEPENRPPRRHRAPVPYDPMDELLAEYPPPGPPERARGPVHERRIPFPAVAGLIAVVIVVIAVMLFVGGGGFFDDTGSTAASLSPESGSAAPGPDVASPTVPPVSSAADEQLKAFTGSIVLLVTPSFDGYEAIVTGGSRIPEVGMITITVEDKAGVHVVEWYYPYRGESFVLMRDMYGGVPARVERVMAEATFESGEKELIWDKEY